MSSEVQPRPGDSPNTSGGSSDAEQRDVTPSVQPEEREREREREREQAPPKKKEAKFSSKTPVKLSTSAKRWATESFLEAHQLDPTFYEAVFPHAVIQCGLIIDSGIIQVY
ncbi:ubiquitin-conjugating enzyme E2 E2-like [Tachysurus ichikawai]